MSARTLNNIMMLAIVIGVVVYILIGLGKF